MTFGTSRNDGADAADGSGATGGGADSAATRVPRGPSPIFLGLVAIAGVTGWLLFAGIGDPGLVTFFFVLAAWVVTLSLHEFSHALVAFRNGDVSVAHRGYLTLDPLRYTHVVFSLVLPLVFLLLGGIGLPGGAVFIDRRALKSRAAMSAVSAAGPLANLAIALAARSRDHRRIPHRCLRILGGARVPAVPSGDGDRAEPAAGAGARRLRNHRAVPACVVARAAPRRSRPSRFSDCSPCCGSPR